MKILNAIMAAFLAVVPFGATAGNSPMQWNLQTVFAEEASPSNVGEHVYGLIENPLEPTPPLVSGTSFGKSINPLEEIPAPSTEDADNGFIVINININNSGNNNGNNNGFDHGFQPLGDFLKVPKDGNTYGLGNDAYPMIDHPFTSDLPGVPGETTSATSDWITMPYVKFMEAGAAGLELLQATPMMW